MAQRIVDRLESVQVDEEQGCRSRAAAFDEQAFDLPTEAGAVGKAGHLVEQRQCLDMVQIGADLAEQTFHRHRQVGQFQSNFSGNMGMKIAMGGGQQPLRRGIDGTCGGSDGALGRRPAHRAAQDRDDQRSADIDQIVTRAMAQ